MSMKDEAAIYNLKAVVTETGLKADTLRAWERRYGIPEPKRTDSGHRLYSKRDIETVKWLCERQGEGLTISRAVDLWQRMQAEGEDPVATAIEHGDGDRAVQALAFGAGIRVETLRTAWVDTCMDFDERGGEQILSQAFASLPAEVVCVQILQRGLAEIGSRWHQGVATVQQEHFASALALRRLESMVAATPPPTLPGRLIVGCPPNEEHTFVPLMLTLLLRRQGRDVIYLGANVPLDSLVETVHAARPTLVILTAQQLSTAASLLEMAGILYATQVPLAYGGLIFNQLPGITSVIPGYHLGRELPGALNVVSRILHEPRPKAARDVVDASYDIARERFAQGRAAIEVDMWQLMQQFGLERRHLSAANANIGRNIDAALALGDMGFMGPDIQWVQALLVNHYQMPANVLADYLRAYATAAEAHLGADGHVITAWLREVSGMSELDPWQVGITDRLWRS